MFWEGLILMCVGMGVVFLFLSLLIVATSQCSRFLARFEPPQPKK